MVANDDTSVDTSYGFGHGPRTVICLNGWFGSSRGWGHTFYGALDVDTFRYEFMDYRGYGERRGSGGPYTIDQIAQDVIELADYIGAERFSLVGHSIGGSAIQRVLALAPERVEAIVGICPTPASGRTLDAEGRELYESAARDDTGREAIIDITTGNRLSAKWIDKLVYWSHAHSDQEAFAAYFDAWADTDHSAEVPVGRVPALAITGEFDPIASEENIRETWLPLHPDSEIEVLSNCGHYPMFETPIALATRIETFLYMVGMQQEQAKGA